MAEVTIPLYSSSGWAVSPVVNFTPNWKKIIIGDSITMTCDVGSSGGEDLTYAWYKDGNWMYMEKIFTITPAIALNSGNYSCEAGIERSGTARLDVVAGEKRIGTSENTSNPTQPNEERQLTTHPEDVDADVQEVLGEVVAKVSTTDLVILQVPLDVHEGDDLTLRCLHRYDYTGRYTEFYKEDSVIQNWSETSEFHVGIVNMMNIGRYKCTKEITPKTWNTYVPYTDEAFISIHNLFEIPKIKVTPYPVVEGDNMTLICNTSLSPLRQRTELQFAFYRDGRNVQEFSSSNQYGVQSAQLEDSGNYSCDVRASNGKVKKSSHFIHIMIKELFFTPVLNVSTMEVLEGDNMTMECDTSLNPLIQRTELQFAFYRDGRNVQEFSLSDQYGVQSAQLEDSGNYFCKVTSASNISKKSKDVFVQIRDLFEIPEIKVTPYPVVEGDEMTLTCDTSLSPLRPRTQLKFAFQKDGRNVREFTSYNQYGVQSTQVKDSGKYSCEVTTATNSVKKRSPEILVKIKDLFEIPEIKMTPYPLVEGDEMTLTCDTSLSPLRPRTQLKFAFQKDGRNVREFTLYNQYGVQSTQVKDSGNYSCEVTTTTNSVRKRSPEILVKINGESFTGPTKRMSNIL
ncbi:Fc receptor-like protein 2 [Lithobates pipiens]